MTAYLRTLHTPALTLALVAIAGQGLLGCDAGSGGVAARVERTLATSYPAHATSILGATTAFERRGVDGFALAASDPGAARRGALDRAAAHGLAQGRGLDLALPRRGDGALTVRAGGLTIGVREIDAEGEGSLAGSAVTYRRANGAAIWSATADGAEEWLLLDAGAARAGRVAAAWEIEGAPVREVAGVIEILDPAGTPRIRVTAPAAWDEGGRAVRATLAARDHRIELVVDGGGAPVLVDPAWSATGTMLAPRGYHAAALLPDGKVFVTGGATSGATLASSERFDPVTNAWSVAAPMLAARLAPAAITLASGRVLVAGSLGAPVNGAELYDPSADTWSPAGTMSESRGNATTTLLADGRVLCAGGTGSPPLSSAEIYDPNANAWSAAAPLVAGRSAHAAALLPSGKVLVASGFDTSGVINTVEIYDPVANTWSPGPPMNAGSGYATATTLANGKVLVVGGAAGPGVAFARAELYDPAANTWTPTGSLATGRYYHTATLLPNGQVVVAGGTSAFGSLSSSEVYDPVTGTWSYGPELFTARNAHSATLLPSGVLVAAGGMNVFTGYINSAESLGANGSGAAGLACGSASDCATGYCVDGVCCATACGAGPCDACSVAAGADVDGTCKLFTGPACNDGNACTQTDTCQSGVCAGANPVVCPAPADECHAAGACAPATGLCSTPQAPDETPCTLGACLAGICGPLTTSASSGGATTGATSGATSASAASASASSGGEVTTSTSAGAGGASATGAGGADSTSASAGGASGLASSATGATPDATTGGYTFPTSGKNGGCSLSSAPTSSGGAGPLALLFSLGALLVARARRDRSPRARR